MIFSFESSNYIAELTTYCIPQLVDESVSQSKNKINYFDNRLIIYVLSSNLMVPASQKFKLLLLKTEYRRDLGCWQNNEHGHHL